MEAGTPNASFMDVRAVTSKNLEPSRDKRRSIQQSSKLFPRGKLPLIQQRLPQLPKLRLRALHQG